MWFLHMFVFCHFTVAVHAGSLKMMVFTALLVELFLVLAAFCDLDFRAQICDQNEVYCYLIWVVFMASKPKA